MATIEDRWYSEDEAGNRVPTDRHGRGMRCRARYRTPDGRQRNKSFARKADGERFLITVEAAKLNRTFVDRARAKLTVRTPSEAG